MKYLLTLFLMGVASFGFAQATNDDLLAQAKAQMDNGSYEASINTLNSIHGKLKTKELVDYFLTLNYAKLLEQGDYPSFQLINRVRTQADMFCKTYPNAKNLGDVKIILESIDEYPKNQQDYQVTKNKILERKKLERQEALLADIRKSYAQNDYVQSLKAIQAAKDAGYAESPIQYYYLMTKYRQFDSSKLQTFNEVLAIRKLGEAILGSGEISLSKLSSAEVQQIGNILAGLPTSLDEFVKKQEEKRAAEYALKQQQKFAAIVADYDEHKHAQVILAVNDFPEDSREKMKVNYYQAISRYRLLKSKSTYEFSELASARANLQAYLTRYADVDKTIRKEVTAATDDLRKNFPNSQYAYEAFLKKQEKKERAAVRQASRDMFSNIGYEYGALAPYGLRFETGGRFVGFFTIFRYGLKSNTQLKDYNRIHGMSQPNKAEIIIGPNLKLTNWLLLNIGSGFGIYSHLYRNDYLQEVGYAKTGYLAGYGGITLRLGKFTNLIGGASFININEQFSKKITQPEFTAGLTFNIRK